MWPGVIGLHTWNPGKQSLKDWMAGRLAADYPALGYSGKSGTVAAELVRRRSIIPVLDGLDEIAPALRADALRTLNREFDQDVAVIVIIPVRKDMGISSLLKAIAPLVIQHAN